ncbi:MAG TPA: leucyl aminopeptidase [Steroidobacteraceae bacterium]|jgi:leucyl aminopeptidase|nr:leucyl aminopeptidase [Steroidobacteraceae bacterium]
MEFKATIDAKVRNATGCAVVGLYEDGDLGVAARRLDVQLNGLIGKLHKEGDFSAKLGEQLLLPAPAGAASARVLLIGLGSRSSFGPKQYRKALRAAVQALAKSGATDAAVYLTLEDAGKLDTHYKARAVAEVFSSQLYKVPDLKTGPKPKPPRLATVQVAVQDARGAKAAADGLRVGAAIGSGSALARDLANLPPNICTPAYLGTRALALGKELPAIKVKVLDEQAIKALKMGAFLAVTQGSEQPPRLIVCEYRGGKKDSPPVCLLGKGITFDSGGISLKDPPGMDEMKFDMSGAATVLGALRTVAELELRLNVVVIVATCENMPSGGAVKPSDIVTSMSGQTVEVLNTDAEGRLILCDAITYSRRFKPAAVIDVATLTGACIVALGNHFSGLMSNHDPLADDLTAAGLRADDRVWRLPVGEEYVEQLKSNFADLANVGGREGGACTAASFLSKFAKDLNWAHLDVAGTAWLGGAQKGSTGRPVPLLVEFLLHRARAQ